METPLQNVFELFCLFACLPIYNDLCKPDVNNTITCELLFYIY